MYPLSTMFMRPNRTCATMNQEALPYWIIEKRLGVYLYLKRRPGNLRSRSTSLRPPAESGRHDISVTDITQVLFKVYKNARNIIWAMLKGPLSTSLSLIREGVVCVFHDVFFSIVTANVLTPLDRPLFRPFFNNVVVEPVKVAY